MTLEKKYTDIMSRIIIDLTKDPLCKDIFVEPRKKTVDPKVGNPMDLSTVKKNIKNNCYIGFKQWIDDVNLIWDNAITTYGEDSILCWIAKYYKQKFKKTVDELRCYNVRNFEERLYSLTKNLHELLSNPPKILGVTDEFCQWPSEFNVFTVEHLNDLTQFAKKLVEDNETDKLVEIIKENNPDLIKNNDIDLDFSKLNRKSILEIEKLKGL